MQRRATAIAIVLLVAGVAAGFAGAPVTAQDDDDQGQDNDDQGQDASSSSSTNCPASADFEVPEKHSNAVSRDLDPNEELIAFANVTSGNPRNLTMHLETVPDTIGVEVFFLDAGDECAEFNESGCDQSVSVTGHTDICTLEAPEDRTYWVHNLNEGATVLTFHEFAPEV